MATMTTRREISLALHRSVQGKSGRNVYTVVDGIARRIIAVRTHKGRVEGRLLADGRWVPITQAEEA